MAKIYETQRDFEQDKLKDQVKDTNLRAASHAVVGTSAALLGSAVNNLNTERSGGLKAVSWALLAVGVVEWVRSLFIASKGRDLAKEHERMGPQTVIFPPEIAVQSAMGMSVAGEPSCTTCKHKASRTVQPTTLLERAEKSDTNSKSLGS